MAPPRLEPVLLAATSAALVAGGVAWLTGNGDLADLLWGLGTLSAVLPAVGWGWPRCGADGRASI